MLRPCGQTALQYNTGEGFSPSRTFNLDSAGVACLALRRYSRQGFRLTPDSGGSRGKLNEFGHDYSQIGGPIDESICKISLTEIHLLLCTKLQCRIDGDFRKADDIRKELTRSGISIDEKAKTWRADVEPSFACAPSANANGATAAIPRMSDCRRMEDAIEAIHDNLDGARPRDLAAFWTVVPKLLGGRAGEEVLTKNHKEHRLQKMVPQLKSILDETIKRLGGAGGRDLAQTALAFARLVEHVRWSKKRNARGVYHDFLEDFLARRRDAVFRTIADASEPVLPEFDPRGLSNLAYACALMEHAPELGDGSALFDLVAEESVPLLEEFNPQELSLLLWSFEKVGASHPRLFEKAADHIVSLETLSGFRPQNLSNLLLAYTKARVSHPALFNRVAEHVVSLNHLGAFNVLELTNTVWAFSKARVSHPLLFEKVGDHIVSLNRPAQFYPQTISNILLSYVRGGVSHPALFEKVAQHILSLDHLDTLNEQVLSNIVCAFAKAGVRHPYLFERVANHIVALDRPRGGGTRNVNPRALSNLAWAYATAEASHPALFDWVAGRVVARRSLAAFHRSGLSDLIWAFAEAGVADAALFDQVAEHVVGLEDLGAFSARNVRNLAWGYARANMPHAGLFDKLADHVISLEDLEMFDRQDICDLAQAFSDAGVDNPRLSDKMKASVAEAPVNIF